MLVRTRRTRIRIRGLVSALAGMLLVAVTVAGCGTTQARDSTNRSSSEQSSGQPPTASAGKDAAADRVMVPVRGKTTVAYFFAAGCIDCLPAAKAVAAVPKTVGDGDADTAYVAVNMAPGDTASNLRGFLAEAAADDMHLVVDGAPLVQRHQVTALSTTLVFDAQGKEVFRGIDAGTESIATAVEAAHAANDSGSSADKDSAG